MQRESMDLLRYFRRRVPAQDAADLLAETGLVAWRRAGALPASEDGARRWLFAVAHNVLRNHQRGQRRRHALADRVRDVLVRVGGPAPGADDGVEVRDAIARLEPDLAEVVRLVHWEGFTVTEAAEVIGRSPSTTRARYQRAREQLRAMLSLEAIRP